MPNKQYAQLMARYNMWQNDNLISATNTLSDDKRQKDRGAFFGSIEQRFSHLLWGDQIWMSRFAGTPEPDGGISQSNRMNADWPAFCEARRAFDQRILQWAGEVEPDWFNGDMTWHSGAIGREITKPKGVLVVQLCRAFLDLIESFERSGFCVPDPLFSGQERSARGTLGRKHHKQFAHV